MAKQAIYMEEARRRYVEEGLSLDAIVGMLGKNVSRKTLYNWKETYEWDAKRKAFLEQNEDRRDQIIALEKQLFTEVKANATSKNIKRWLLLLAAVEKYGGNAPKIKDDSPEQKENFEKLYTPELLDHIKHALYGLK